MLWRVLCESRTCQAVRLLPIGSNVSSAIGTGRTNNPEIQAGRDCVDRCLWDGMDLLFDRGDFRSRAPMSTFTGSSKCRKKHAKITVNDMAPHVRGRCGVATIGQEISISCDRQEILMMRVVPSIIHVRVMSSSRFEVFFLCPSVQVSIVCWAFKPYRRA